MSPPQSIVLSVKILDITIISASRRVYMIDNVYIDDSRIVKDIHIPSELTSDVDELIKSSILRLDEIHVHEESISDIQDVLVESSTLALDEMLVHDESISDVQYALVESSTSSHDIRYSLSTPMIKKEIEQEIVAANVDTSESLWFLSIIYQVTFNVF